MDDELGEKFPKLMLQSTQVPTGGWVVASLTKPLTQEDAGKVIIAYQTIHELIARR